MGHERLLCGIRCLLLRKRSVNYFTEIKLAVSEIDVEASQARFTLPAADVDVVSSIVPDVGFCDNTFLRGKLTHLAINRYRKLPRALPAVRAAWRRQLLGRLGR